LQSWRRNSAESLFLGNTGRDVTRIGHAKPVFKFPAGAMKGR
jgi:hypothetical protein